MSSNAYRKRQGKRPGSGRRSLALRAALVVSLWHAPVPWVHFHDLEGPQVESLDPLSRHIAEYHAGDVHHGHKSLTWHTHLVLPWCLDGHDACPRDHDGDHAPRPDDTWLVVTAGASSLQSTLSLGRLARAANPGCSDSFARAVVAPQEVVAAATVPPCGWQRHFFETYGPSIAVRDLIGVRVC